MCTEQPVECLINLQKQQTTDGGAQGEFHSVRYLCRAMSAPLLANIVRCLTNESERVMQRAEHLPPAGCIHSLADKAPIQIREYRRAHMRLASAKLHSLEQQT
jgi:hypothetical protein